MKNKIEDFLTQKENYRLLKFHGGYIDPQGKVYNVGTFAGPMGVYAHLNFCDEFGLDEIEIEKTWIKLWLSHSSDSLEFIFPEDRTTKIQESIVLDICKELDLKIPYELEPE